MSQVNRNKIILDSRRKEFMNLLDFPEADLYV